MTMPEFAKWPSIQRLSSEICWITEKIDGTNGVIFVPDEPDKPWRDDIQIPDVCVVPVLYTGEPTEGIIDATVATLKERGSYLYPGFMKPEGVVVTYKNMKTCKWKRLCENDKIHKWQQK